MDREQIILHITAFSSEFVVVLSKQLWHSFKLRRIRIRQEHIIWLRTYHVAPAVY